MISDPIERLRAANPEPQCPPPSIDEVWRRIEATDQRPRSDVRRARPRSLPSVIAVLASAAVVIAVASIALLAHGRSTSAASSAGTKQLVAKLAVLRRPQTAADRLPGHLHIQSPETPQGKIIARFTRLVRTLPGGTRLYLVVTTWSPDSSWSKRLGDQVAIVELSGGRAGESLPIPAADLTNANQVSPLTPFPPGARAAATTLDVSIVPDGVARVRWTFLKLGVNPRILLDIAFDLTVTDNVAVSGLDTSLGALRNATWYKPDGQRFATSNRAQLAAQAAQNAKLKAQAIRYILQHPHTADPSLLAAYAVFAVTSPTGVKTASGDIISRPPLSSLPLGVVQSPPRQDELFGLDYTQVRQVITPSGVRLYVIPGSRGLCLLTGGGGGGCNLLPGVETQGISMSGGSDGVGRTYKLLPKRFHRIAIPTGQTIPLPDGVYVSPSRPTPARRLPCGTRAGNRPGVPYRCLPRPR